MTHEEASAGPARRGGTRHEREHHTSSRESGEERDGGNVWDELGSRWEGGGLVRVGSLVEKTTTLSSLRQLHTYLLQSFACCFQDQS